MEVCIYTQRTKIQVFTANTGDGGVSFQFFIIILVKKSTMNDSNNKEQHNSFYQHNVRLVMGRIPCVVIRLWNVVIIFLALFLSFEYIIFRSNVKSTMLTH